MKGPANPIAKEFVEALGALEQRIELEPLVDLFADDAELTSLTEREPLRGKEGARRFWRGYRSAFEEVNSTFDRTIEADGTVVLEWHTDGKLPDGQNVAYRGVSILELAEDRLGGFRTYYDSAAFVQPKAESARR